MKRKTIWTIITQYIYFFFLCSFAGFLWEVVLLYVKTGAFYKRGFLYGPWLPVYGIGAVLFFLLLQKKKNRPVAIFLYSMLIGGGVELAVGWFLDTVWKLRYWNYSSSFLNLNGYICLYSVLGFGIAGVLWVCVLERFSRKMWYRMPRNLRNVLLTLLIIAFITDCAAALIFPNKGHGVTFPAVQYISIPQLFM